MLSKLHETLIEMFRRRPAVAADLLAGSLGMQVPAYQGARVESAEFTDVTPTQYRADAVVVLTVGKKAVLAVVVEVQLGRDPVKRWSWPVYVATLRARLRCPTVLLVVCVDRRLAAWCGAPIDLGHPGLSLAPLVLGPDRVPVVTDVEQVGRDPELAVLSAMAHGRGPERSEVFDALLGGLKDLEWRRGKLLYLDVVLDALPTAARSYLEALMAAQAYEYKSDFARRYVSEGRVEGRAEGRAESVLAVLEARGITIPEDAQTRIAECVDLDQLNVWVRRAATVVSIEDLFA